MMYRFALGMTPDQVEAVAAQAYVEMLEAGFTRVGEFHYLHHEPDGRATPTSPRWSGRIVAAAEATRIGLTLLPVFYAHAGFGGAPPGDAQRRFICDLDVYARLVERAATSCEPRWRRSRRGAAFAPRRDASTNSKRSCPRAGGAAPHPHRRTGRGG